MTRHTQYPQPIEREEVIEGWTFKPVQMRQRRMWFIFRGAESCYFAIVNQRADESYVLSATMYTSTNGTWDETVRLFLNKYGVVEDDDGLVHEPLLLPEVQANVD